MLFLVMPGVTSQLFLNYQANSETVWNTSYYTTHQNNKKQSIVVDILKATKLHYTKTKFR